ncbi:hypothetical protein ACO2Q3_23500 [Caulobacter sp. KR2-114]|uniref:hypothetical protein n=1 Tax=Caulobacter sp. KR2-114 TaxID=3400912 RepID=UPI003C03B848
MGAVATSALAACAAVAVVALAFAEYALIETWLGRAGAAACVAGTAALLIGLAAVIVSAGGAAKKPPPAPARSDAFLERAFDFVKEKPVVAVAAALAAGFLAVRNPGYLGAAVRSFLEGEPPTTRR